MIAKELRDVRWKLVIGAFLFLVMVAKGFDSYETPAGEVRLLPKITTADGMTTEFMRSADSTELAVFSMWNVYEASGQFILTLFAAVLGASMFSSEVSQGTIFLLLSKPIGRMRLLLIKYGVGASALFLAALLGSVGVIFSASAHGWHSSGAIDFAGVLLSTLLLLLGSLSVLGLALLVSVVFGGIVRSAIAVAVALAFFGQVPLPGPTLHAIDPRVEATSLPGFWAYPREYWASQGLYFTKEFAVGNFLICLIAAVLPLLAALWLFNRKAY
jgi:ABC-2 type transport system permease protein